MTQTPPNPVQLLEDCEALQRLSDAGRAKLAAALEIKRCPLGQTLVMSTGLPEQIFVVVEGDSAAL